MITAGRMPSSALAGPRATNISVDVRSRRLRMKIGVGWILFFYNVIKNVLTSVGIPLNASTGYCEMWIATKASIEGRK